MSDETRTVTLGQLAAALRGTKHRWTTKRRPEDDAECARLGCKDRTHQVHHRDYEAEAAAVFAALPTSTEGLDVERLAEAMRATYGIIAPGSRTVALYSSDAPVIAAEYARLASLSPSPTEENPE